MKNVIAYRYVTADFVTTLPYQRVPCGLLKRHLAPGLYLWVTFNHAAAICVLVLTCEIFSPRLDQDDDEPNSEATRSIPCARINSKGTLPQRERPYLITCATLTNIAIE